MKPDRADTDLTTALLAEHEHLEQRFRDVTECVRTAERAIAQREWDEFERTLLAHLAWEETHLLPAFERAMPREAAAVHADHARFRALLTELGLQLDLRALRAERVDEFIALLRSHAAREESTLYRWASTTVPAHEHPGLLARLEHMVDARLI